jgi:hypothetical protein
LWELKQVYWRKKVQEKANLSPLESFKCSFISLKPFFFSFLELNLKIFFNVVFLQASFIYD